MILVKLWIKMLFLYQDMEKNIVLHHLLLITEETYIAAFKLGAECVITTNAVGSMRDNMIPGSLIIPDQILDFTSGRKNTFFDGSDFSVTTKKGETPKRCNPHRCD